MNKKKEAEELGKQRIQETAPKLGGGEVPAGTSLFTKTDRPPLTEERPGHEPIPVRARKSRAWDRRPENRKFSYRLGQDIDDLINEAVADYKAAGWHTTKGDVLRAWAMAGRELWLEGQVEVSGYPIGDPGAKRERPTETR